MNEHSARGGAAGLAGVAGAREKHLVGRHSFTFHPSYMYRSFLVHTRKESTSVDFVSVFVEDVAFVCVKILKQSRRRVRPVRSTTPRVHPTA